MFTPFSESWAFLKGMTGEQDHRIQAHRTQPIDNRRKKQFIRNTIMDLINRRDEITPETNPELFDENHPRFDDYDRRGELLAENPFDAIFETLVDRDPDMQNERIPKKMGHFGLQQEELDILSRILFGLPLDGSKWSDAGGTRKQPLSDDNVRMIQSMHDRMKMDYPDVDMTRQPSKPDARMLDLLDKDPKRVFLNQRDKEARKLAEKQLEEYHNQMAANVGIDYAMGLDEMIPDHETTYATAELQRRPTSSGSHASRLGGRTEPDMLDAMAGYDEQMRDIYNSLGSDKEKQRFLDMSGRNQIEGGY